MLMTEWQQHDEISVKCAGPDTRCFENSGPSSHFQVIEQYFKPSNIICMENVQNVLERKHPSLLMVNYGAFEVSVAKIARAVTTIGNYRVMGRVSGNVGVV